MPSRDSKYAPLLLTAALLCGTPLLAKPSFRVCQGQLALMAEYYQRGAVGRENRNLLSELPKLFPHLRPVAPGTSVPSTGEWFEALHNDILEYLVADPTQRSFEAFRDKYGFTDSQLTDALTYFASRHYFNALQTLGNPRDSLARLSELSRA